MPMDFLTQAVATLPGVAVEQGIYREIADTTLSKPPVDVRVDQLGDVDPSVNVEDPNNPGFLLCGCPVGTENVNDWPMAVGWNLLTEESPNFLETAFGGVLASA